MYRTSEIVFVKPGLTDTSRNMFTFDQEDDMKTPRLALYILVLRKGVITK